MTYVYRLEYNVLSISIFQVFFSLLHTFLFLFSQIFIVAETGFNVKKKKTIVGNLFLYHFK